MPYHVKVEVLRSGGTTISSIFFNGVDFGECIAPGPNDECSFHDCSEELNWKASVDNSHRLVSSPFGTVALDIDLKSLSKNCDCNKDTWECGKASSIANGSPLISAIKITLTPLGKSPLFQNRTLSLTNAIVKNSIKIVTIQSHFVHSLGIS